jgi:putative nucleotidyltransferase with HDIG domain
MWRYLPAAILVTALVTVVPAALAAALAPRRSPFAMVLSGALAVALSIALATAAAALWKRHPRSRDILFADLLLWGWLRRWWTERRLSQARELYDSACRAGPLVSIQLLTGLGRLLEARDAYTHGHGSRVARQSERIARAMHLPAVDVAKIRTAAAVHDLGKLYTPREILNNPGRLTDEEFDVVKRHAADGAEMLAGVGDPEIAAMVRHHHERFDGDGYPDGLAGTEIPLGARIIAVADTFDAITSNRAYRGAGTQKLALKVIANGAGSQLDPDAVSAFRQRYSGRRSVAWLALATAVLEQSVLALRAATQAVTTGGGLASILPALGAAGLFSLSPALDQHAASAHQRARVLAPAHATTRAVATHRAPKLATGGSRSRQGATHPRRSIGRAAPVRPTVRHPVTGTHGSPLPPPPSHRETGSSSTPASAPGSSPQPPITVPHVEVPTPQTNPSTPPVPPAGVPEVTVPAVPGVPVPPVHVPVPVPSIPVPSVNTVVGGVLRTG